jgi:peptidoglycan hydrolase-like protein with peptidoglycan-binding domain
VAGTVLWAAPASAQNACRWAFNNQCDEPVQGGTGQCPPGTDQADCTALLGPVPMPTPIAPPPVVGVAPMPPVVGIGPVPGASASVVYDVQVELRRVGYNPGPLDGVIGPRTREAIRRFQRDYGHAVTGQATADLLTALKSVR